MRLDDQLRLILRAVLASRMRSGLTALGIAIGIAAVALLTSIGEGVRHYVLEQFSQFGTRIIAVQPGTDQVGGMGGILSTTRPLSLADAYALRTLPGVEAVIPVVQGTGEISSGPRSRASEIIGVGAQMAHAWRFDIAYGRFLPEDGEGQARPYVVLGHKMKEELFGQQNPLGQLVRVGGMRFRVIGVMEPKGQMLGFDLDDMVFIPAQLGLQLFNREGLMEIDITFAQGTSADHISRRITQRLIERHGAKDFSIVTQDQMLASLNNILSVLTLAVAALGSISLFVGGVGILTIMTTTVRERTGEIGLLRAIGTTQRQILGLFLGEAVLLSLLGGGAGLLIMFLIVAILQLFAPDLPIQPNLLYLLLALILSGLIGLLAGVSPALRAAKMDPIEALRAE